MIKSVVYLQILKETERSLHLSTNLISVSLVKYIFATDSVLNVLLAVASVCIDFGSRHSFTESLMWHWSLKSESVDITDSVISIIILFLIYAYTFQTSNSDEMSGVLC